MKVFLPMNVLSESDFFSSLKDVSLRSKNTNIRRMKLNSIHALKSPISVFHSIFPMSITNWLVVSFKIPQHDIVIAVWLSGFNYSWRRKLTKYFVLCSSHGWIFFREISAPSHFSYPKKGKISLKILIINSPPPTTESFLKNIEPW